MDSGRGLNKVRGRSPRIISHSSGVQCEIYSVGHGTAVHGVKCTFFIFCNFFDKTVQDIIVSSYRDVLFL
jgi:hypothetical protein